MCIVGPPPPRCPGSPGRFIIILPWVFRDDNCVLAGSVCEHISVRQVRCVRFVGLHYTPVAADDRLPVGRIRRQCRRLQRRPLSTGRPRRPTASCRARRPPCCSQTDALSYLQRLYHQRRTAVLTAVAEIIIQYCFSCF